MTALLGAAYHAGESLPSPVTKIGIYRFFFPPGKMQSPQKWSGQTNAVKAHDQYGARTFSISWKPDNSGATPFTSASINNINNFLDSVPSDVDRANLLLTFYHEHDGNIRDGSLKIADYKAGSKVIADIAHKHGCKYGPIHNGVNRQNGTTGSWGLWPAVWKANEADLSLYDFWGTDCYSTNYEDPSPRMDPIKAYADSLNLPVLIAEVGAPKSDQTKQVAWAKKMRTWALANADWVSYWSSQVSATDPDYRLTDASAKAWFGLA